MMFNINTTLGQSQQGEEHVEPGDVMIHWEVDYFNDVWSIYIDKVLFGNAI